MTEQQSFAFTIISRCCVTRVRVLVLGIGIGYWYWGKNLQNPPDPDRRTSLGEVGLARNPASKNEKLLTILKPHPQNPKSRIKHTQTLGANCQACQAHIHVRIGREPSTTVVSEKRTMRPITQSLNPGHATARALLFVVSVPTRQFCLRSGTLPHH